MLWNSSFMILKIKAGIKLKNGQILNWQNKTIKSLFQDLLLLQCKLRT